MPNGPWAPRYDLVDLRVFLAVVDERSVLRGAARAHLAPSSVSERIAALEQTLGTTLLERLPRGVAPTTAGFIVAEHARRCMAQLEQMHADLAPYGAGLAGHVTLFTNSTAMTSFMPDLLAGFFAVNPQIHVRLEEMMSGAVAAAVAQGRADIGVVAGEMDHPDLTFVPFVDVRLAIVTSRCAALAERRDVRLSDCARETFISLHSGAAIHTFLMERAAEAGFRPNVRVQVSDYLSIKRMVGSGAGIALVPATVVTEADDDLALVPLQDGWARRKSKLCYREAAVAANRGARTLLDHALAWARAIG